MNRYSLPRLKKITPFSWLVLKNKCMLNLSFENVRGRVIGHTLVNVIW